MGIYVELPNKFGKAEQLKLLAKAVELKSGPQVYNPAQGKTYVVVVENPQFDAALIAGDQAEIDRVNRSIANGDDRHVHWLLVDKSEVVKLNPRASTTSNGRCNRSGLVLCCSCSEGAKSLDNHS